MTFVGHVASLARPIAIACFARTCGSAALGTFVLVWTTAEIGARLATLGIDRGLQRWADDNRAAAAAAGLVIAGASGLAIAVVLMIVLPRIGPFEANEVLPAQIAIGLTLPLIAMASVALRTARGQAQITSYVMARNVAEPLLLLVAGVVLSSTSPGPGALLAAYVISVAGGSVIAGYTLVRALGRRPLMLALRRRAEWPVRTLVGTSVPLGLADLLQNAQAKFDLIAVAVITLSGPAIAAYAIAAELVAVFSSIRQGFDQVIAPIAAELRDERRQLIDVMTRGIRWSACVAAPIALVMIACPATLLEIFGGSTGAASVLVVLVVGRAVETILGPAASILAMIGRPRLALLDASAGVVLAIIGQIAFGASGPVWIAVASSIGVVTASLLALFWLASLEEIRFKWSIGAPAPHSSALASIAGVVRESH